MENIAEHYLYPGALFAHIQPHIVTTVLGSCVSVCLWDPVLRIGGINHYQMPLWNGNGLASPKYGNIAIEKLLEKMLAMGSQKLNLKAKLFGGASVLQGVNHQLRIGERNSIIGKDMINKEGIPIISLDVGGNFGRKLRFNTQTGDVLRKLIKST